MWLALKVFRTSADRYHTFFIKTRFFSPQDLQDFLYR